MSDSVIRDADLIQGEIEAEAEQRRRSEPELLHLEREIERVWGEVVPDAAGLDEDGLLERVDQLSLINVDAPTGNRRGIGEVKRVVRKFTRWYLRYVVDQLNAFHHFQGRLLHGMDKRLTGLDKRLTRLDRRSTRLDQRLTRLEREARLQASVSELAGPPPEADPGLGEAVAQYLSLVDGPVAVVSCGSGSIVAALDRAGVCAHGVDESAASVMSGVTEGLDLRVGSPLKYLNAFADATLAAVVLTRAAEHEKLVELLALIDEVLRCLAPGGMVVVAVADPGARTGPEAELLRGCGLAPETWTHLLSERGCTTETVEFSGSRVETLVVAQSL